MSSVTPPVPSPPPLQVQGLPTATLNAPPLELTQLNIGTKLDAIVLSLISKGAVDIETTHGNLQLQTYLSLPKGAAIQLQLIGKGSQLQFLITAIGGKTPMAFLRTPGLGPQGPGTSLGNAVTPPTGNANPVSLLAGTQTTATLLRAISPGLPGTPGASGGPVPSTVVGTSAHPATALTPAGSATGQGLTADALNTAKTIVGQSASHQPGSSTPSQQTPEIPAGSRFGVRITNIIPANQLGSGGGLPSTSSTSFLPGQSITGVVVGQNNTHHPIVQTHAGPIAIITPSSVPIGTTIAFQILSALPESAGRAQHAVIGRTGSIIMETREWQHLNDAFKLLSDSNPAIAQQVMNSALPRPDSALTANILLFIAALRGSEIRNWFGDAPARALERLRPGLAARLSDDFSQIARLSDDNAGGDWRSIPVPMLNGPAIEQVQLFMRRKRRNSDEDSAPETRFVIDVDLRQIGRIQMDGLIIQEKKSFDLIFRSEDHLTPRIQNDIRTIFTNANELTGTSGGLVFRAAPPDFVEISSETVNDDGLGLIV